MELLSLPEWVLFCTFVALLNAGDHIISSRSVFGSTHSLFTKYFPKWHINTSYFNIDQIDQIEKLIQKTKCICVEFQQTCRNIRFRIP